MNKLKTILPLNDILSETRHTEVLGRLILLECSFRFNVNSGSVLYRVYCLLVLFSDYGSISQLKGTKVSVMSQLGLKSRVYDQYLLKLKKKGLIRMSDGDIVMIGFEGIDTRKDYKKLIMLQK